MLSYPIASSTWDEAEYAALQRVIASDQFTMGPEVAAFEQAFAEYLGVPYTVMVNSGSSANLLMVAALCYRQQQPLKRGDEVIVPAVAWSTSYFPFYQYGLKLKFVDIDLQTLNYDLEALKSAVTETTRVILAVNILGNPNHFELIKQMIAHRPIILLEDNCEALGAQYRGQLTGTFGLMASFSFFFSHHISTMEGGLIATADEELYHILLALRAHGWTRNLPEHNQVHEKSQNSLQEAFNFVLPGYSLRPLEFAGAVGQAQLKKLPQMLQVRRENAAQFLELIKQFPYLIPQQQQEQSSWFGLSLIIDPQSALSRQQLIQVLAQQHIEVRPILSGNFTRNKAIHWFDYTLAGPLNNADIIDQNGLFLGNHHWPLTQQFNVLATALQQINQLI
ncbi:MAG: DegT/DnrJ/EryC1/StrS family aminotransferase [Pseudomonadota bacterium]|nr:DegT/DnrJ/EryC1/StrS family aminotransferase [Pseudomonadota bacterium]